MTIYWSLWQDKCSDNRNTLLTNMLHILRIYNYFPTDCAWNSFICSYFPKSTTSLTSILFCTDNNCLKLTPHIKGNSTLISLLRIDLISAVRRKVKMEVTTPQKIANTVFMHIKLETLSTHSLQTVKSWCHDVVNLRVPGIINVAPLFPAQSTPGS